MAAALFIGGIASILLPVAPGKAERLRVVVPTGAGTLGVAKVLAKAGVVRTALGFAVLAEITGGARHLEAGTYLLSPGSSPLAVVRTLVRGAVAVRTFTVVPGQSLEEAAAAMQAAGLFPAAKFVQSSRHAALPHGFGPVGPVRDRLEGFLPPATYRVPLGSNVAQVTAILRDQFNRFFTTSDARAAKKQGLTPRGALTLASIVEREAATTADRRQVARVFLNRLRIGMPLQSDATVLYAVGRSKLNTRDFASPSPFNTYTHVGLPPGPICAVSEQSLAAVLHPAKNGDYYFITLPDGKMVFSSTLSGQEAALARAASHRNHRQSVASSPAAKTR